MKDLLDKLSSYNIFNYLLPGILFSVLTDKLTTYTLIQSDIFLGIFLYYFIGLIISRVGSLFVDLMLKTIGFIKSAPYQDFISASGKDSKLEVLSEVNNMYRTFVSLFLCLILVKFYNYLSEEYMFIQNWQAEIFVIFLLSLFLFSYKKQTEYIIKRISFWTNKN